MRIFMACFILSTVLLWACSSNDNGISTGGGMLQMELTDQPIDLREVSVTLSEIEVHETGGAWRSFSDSTKSVDLLSLKGVRTVLAIGELRPGTYTGFRLFVDEGHIIDQAGDRCDLKVPSGKIEVPVTFEIKEGNTTDMLVDFDAEQSVHVVRTGNNERCILRPVLKAVSVTNQS